MNRREFVKQSSLAVGAMGAAAAVGCQSLAGGSSNSLYDISLAQWALNRQFFGGKLNALDFAKVTKEEFDLDAIEYVNQFFKDKANDESYLGQLKSRAADHGVKSLLIMVDGEGSLGHGDTAERNKAVLNHHKWVDAAKFLGCIPSGSTPPQPVTAVLRRNRSWLPTACVACLSMEPSLA